MKTNIKIWGIAFSLIAISSSFLIATYLFILPTTDVQNSELKVGVFPGDVSSIIYVAQNKRIYNQNNLNVTIKEYESGFQATNSLINKDIDIATVSDFAFVNPSYSHPELRIIGTASTFQTTFIIARQDHGIKNITDLENKTIGVPFGTSAQFFLGIFILLNDLTNSSINILNISPKQLEPALLNGSIDAFAGWNLSFTIVKLN